MRAMRSAILLLASTLMLAACAGGTTTVTTSDGTTGRAKIYRIPAQESRVQFRMLDAVNALRQASGAQTLELNASLNAAAMTHARDISLQNRPWHFGSDGSSPIQRAQRAGYTQTVLGENISETYETEIETLTAWMEQDDTRAALLDSDGADMGFGWFQEPGGKIWWTLLVGGGGVVNVPEPSPIAELAQG